jgi:MFS transporter, ACS family, hexuronate transporter
VAPPMVIYIARRFGWRGAFLIPSLAGGLCWIPLWLRASNLRHPVRSSRPFDSTPLKTRLGNLLKLRQTWGVVLMRALSGPLSQFYWYFLPLYLVRGRGLSMGVMAGLASVSYMAGGCGELGAGYFSGFLIRHGWDTDYTRKFIYTSGTLVAGSCTLIAPLIHSSLDAAALIAVANFGINVMGNHNMAVVTDVFPSTTLASVTGMTGMGEGLIDMAMMLFAGIIIDRFSWFPVFAVAAFMPAGALASLFLLVRQCRPLNEPKHNTPQL